MQTLLTQAEANHLDNASPANALTKLGTKLKGAQDEIVLVESLGGRHFRAKATLTAAAAATPVSLVSDAVVAAVGASKKIYVETFHLSVGGGTAWTDTTATVVRVRDRAGTPLVAVEAAKAQLTANAQLGLVSAGITLHANVKDGSGLTAGKGIELVADANFAAGSDITVQVTGTIAD